MNGEVVGSWGATYDERETLNKVIKRTRKLANDSEFKVCVKKAIPVSPKKGMCYFFANDIRYKLPPKKFFSEGGKITIPASGKFYFYYTGSSYKTIKNGTVINKDNYDEYIYYSNVLIKEVEKPVLVRIKNEYNNLNDNTCEIIPLDTIFSNFECKRKYRRIERAKLVYEVPNVHLKKGDIITWDEFNNKYVLLRNAKRRLSYFGRTVPKGFEVDENKKLIKDGKIFSVNRLMTCGERRAERYFTEETYCFVYIARILRKGMNQMIGTPVLINIRSLGEGYIEIKRVL